MGPKLFIFCFLIIFVIQFPGQNAQGNPYAYKCVEHICVKGIKTPEGTGETSLGKCKLNCGKYGSLWPQPTTDPTIDAQYSNFILADITFIHPATIPAPILTRLELAENIFKEYLTKAANGLDNSVMSEEALVDLPIKITVNFTSNAEILKLDTNEAYSIVINTIQTEIQVSITGETYFGVRHGLETLSQLIVFDEGTSYAIVKSASIEDKPVYPYRGLMLDTSRNFMSLDVIHSVIDGLSYNKLNIFHWHITDTHSFPMEVTGQPNMTQFGAYSSKKVYTVTDMKDLREYATTRGVKIVIEFDAPAHTGNGWLGWGAQDEPLAVCVNKDPWYDNCVQPPCGQLNIANPKMYDVLGDIYKTMMEVFDGDIFHMGGDEVDLRCYNSTPVITDYMAAQTPPMNRTVDGFMRLLNEFQTKAYAKWTEALGATPDPLRLALLWTSEFTSHDYITKYVNNTQYAIQIWTNSNDAIIPFLIDNKYKVIFSNVDAWYFDCGYHNWIGDSGHNWCSPYKTWQIVYENSPFKIYEAATTTEKANAALAAGLLMGGVAPLWTEEVEGHAVASRFWPRGCALAERLWADPKTTGPKEATTRIVNNRQRLVERGIMADGLQPEWCHQNEGKCVEAEKVQPPTTEAPTTGPPTTEPPTTKPPITEPPTTKPPITEPPTTKPPITEPPTTEPPTTEPLTTVAGINGSPTIFNLALTVSAIVIEMSILFLF